MILYDRKTLEEINSGRKILFGLCALRYYRPKGHRDSKEDRGMNFIESLKKHLHKGIECYVNRFVADKFEERRPSTGLIRAFEDNGRIFILKPEEKIVYKNYVAKINKLYPYTIEDLGNCADIFLSALVLGELGKNIAIVTNQSKLIDLGERVIGAKLVNPSTFGIYVRRGEVDDFERLNFLNKGTRYTSDLNLKKQ